MSDIWNIILLVKNAKSTQEFKQGDRPPALGWGVGRQWQEILTFSSLHRWECETHVGLPARG